jgi:4-amino-4-deoxy-L-arabinose transferase-like glycosyltransferase
MHTRRASAVFDVRLPALLALFFVGLLPFSANYVIYYPDERHYTDAAISMVQDGNYFAPKNPDGSLRFRKPILTYWLVAASYAILGVNTFASRLPFLLAGFGVIWLTYQLALRLTRNPQAARLAAVIMLSHPQLILSSTRSLPDVLLCLFMLLSAYGFIGIIFLERRAVSDYLAAYVGAGLAVLSKGFLALILVAFAWGFAWHGLREWAVLRRLIHLPSMAAAVIVGGGWYASMYWLYGRSFWGEFWGDQVAEKVAVGRWESAAHILLFLVLYILNFLPWSLAVGEARKRHGATQVEPHRRDAHRFILLWGLLIAVVLGLGINVSVRYLLPASPLLAVYFADLLHRSSAELKYFSFGRLLKILLTIFAMIGIGASVIIVDLMSSLRGIGVLSLFLAAVAVLMIGVKTRWCSTAVALGIAIFLLFPFLFLSLQPLILPDQSAQIARKLDELGLTSYRPILFIGRSELASRIRVSSGGVAELHQTARFDPSRLLNYQVIILPAKDAVQLSENGYQIEKVPNALGTIPMDRLFDSVWSRPFAGTLQKNIQEYALAMKCPAPGGRCPARERS